MTAPLTLQQAHARWVQAKEAKRPYQQGREDVLKEMADVTKKFQEQFGVRDA